ncbi:MAG: DUF2807 domain-containing protein [Sphingomonadales bacterium]|nr:DUF2807 domain-containing protein [Sphingomonadales bacterium]MDE2568310.1 DUF2807 domain-containing protein [Sphingomonadales bacterium]
MLKDFARALAGAAVLGIAASLGGCDGANIHFGSDGGVPLSQLDLSGKTANEVALLGPDTVTIATGKKLAITVTGDDAIKDKLRFRLDDGKLSIMRENGLFSKGGGVATVAITMPAPRKLSMLGSGSITADRLAGDKAEIASMGSGTIDARAVEAGKLKVDVLGSGNVTGAGSADRLKLAVMGSGKTDLSRLKAGSAKIDVMGSGDAGFASDGEVEAKIMGSGTVRVTGRAKCTVKAMGSGKLVCESADTP